MSYQEQLKDPRWQEKRKIILSRDNYTCQKCNNESYRRKNVLKGLVISNSLNFRSNNHFALDKWRFLVWNFRDNELFRGSTDSSNFSSEKSYICFYCIERVEGLLKFQVLGLKEIPNTHILFKNVDFIKTLTSNNYKDLVERQTFDFVYSSDFEPKTCSIIFGLQVHHTYYHDGKYAWDYPDECLTTLCPTCHNEIHLNTEIPIFDFLGNELERLPSSTVISNPNRLRRRRG